MRSLSVRRAWIEIIEGTSYDEYAKSLSVRRAWIEIDAWLAKHLGMDVALREESVD